MFTNILEYQALDEKLSKMIRDFESLPERDSLNKLVHLVRDNQAKLIEVNEQAKKTISLFEKTKSDYENIKNQIEQLSSKSSSFSDEERNKAIEKLEKFTLDLSSIERSLSTQVESIKSILSSFENYKKNIIIYKQKYKEAKEKCALLEQEFAPKIKELKDSLAKLEKNVDPKVMLKYKQLKQDLPLPVIIENNGSSCGGCSMSIPAALMTKLKERGFIECEQCRRIIYYKK